MPTNPQRQTLQRRFPIFASLAIFICFILFPLFLIDAAANRVLQIQSEKSLGKTRHKLEGVLDTLESCSNERHFVHLLLNHAFTSALKSDNPQLSLQMQLNSLKKKYPGIFFFIVWNDKGHIVQRITDES